MKEIVFRQLNMCFDMLEKLVHAVPDKLWSEKRGGFLMWQQIFHALTGSQFWLRSEGGEFREPFESLNLYPELDGEPEMNLTKEQVLELLDETRELKDRLFDSLREEALEQPSVLYDKITNLDVILGQIRHLMYHIGHCNAILRDTDEQAAEWEDYYGE